MGSLGYCAYWFACYRRRDVQSTDFDFDSVDLENRLRGPTSRTENHGDDEGSERVVALEAYMFQRWDSLKNQDVIRKGSSLKLRAENLYSR